VSSPSTGALAMAESVPSVLVIGPTPPPFHGVAVATHSLLRAAGNQRLVLLHLDIADRRGIEHVDKPDAYDVYLFCRQWLRLLGMLLARRPDVVYLAISQGTIGFLRDSLFVGLAWCLRRRIVIHLHGANLAHWFSRRSRPFKALIRAVLGRATRLIVLGEVVRASLDGLVARERIVIVPNGVSWEHGAVPQRVRSPGQKLRVLFLSTLCREKGALVLLEAAALVMRQRQDVEFVLAGPWLRESDRLAANELTARGSLAAHVLLPGAVQGAAKIALYESADLFVFPGIQQEGQPLVAIEAMAAGLPVIFTDRGCLAETVVDQESGLLIRIGDSADLAEKILWLLDRPAERQRLGANARQRYQALYQESRFIADMRSVFLEAAQAPRPTNPRAHEPEATRQYFDRVAVSFNRHYEKREAFRERRLVWDRLVNENLPRAAGMLCLDMGCGDGRLGRVAAARGVRTIGFDQSDEMLCLARSRAREQGLEGCTEYVHAGLPLQAGLIEAHRGAAGLILCSSVLEYIDAYEAVLQQFLELLCKGGRLIVSVPNGHSIYRWAEKLVHGVVAHRNSYLSYQRHSFYPERFRATLHELGYSLVHEEYFAVPLRIGSVKLLGRRRGRRLSTLYVLVAEKP
jgi:glycosyltransferase involved in cell wall biosynthesis/2-polyprenyl-3-methyl-5-hydroxy-6-metoxy-1,4-benzoquinol methylase